MNPPPQDPGRKSLPHLAPMEFPNQSILQFVSCNVARRRPLLANAETHSLLLSAWEKANHWLVGRYVIMPDHVHFFCAPKLFPITPLKRWMEFWRADVTRHCQTASTSRSGKRISSIASFAAAKAIGRSGFTNWRIRSRPAWQNAGKTGPIKASSTFSHGMSPREIKSIPRKDELHESH